jgi:hypothetical protein
LQERQAELLLALHGSGLTDHLSWPNSTTRRNAVPMVGLDGLLPLMLTDLCDEVGTDGLWCQCSVFTRGISKMHPELLPVEKSWGINSNASK